MDLLIRFVENFKDKIDFGLILLVRLKGLIFIDEEIRQNYSQKDVLIRRIF